MIKPFALFLLCVSLITSGYAQQPEQVELPQAGHAPIHFRHLTQEDGFSMQSGEVMLQDHQGFMWFGAQNALNRYDGHTFTQYYAIPFDSTSLVSSNISALFEGRNGTLWVGSWRSLNRFDRATETFTGFVHDEDNPNSLSDGTVRSIFEDQNGMLWAGTEGGGLNRMNPDQPGRFIHFRHDPADSTSLSNNQVFALHEGQVGELWVSTGNGLNRLDPTTGTFTRYVYEPGDPQSNSSNPSNRMGSILEDPSVSNRLWVASGNGLLRFDTQTDTYTRFFDEVGVSGAVTDPIDPGILWVAMQGQGLFRFDTRTEQFTSYQHNPEDAGSPVSNALFGIYKDQAGSIWLLPDDGIDRFDVRNGAFVTYAPEEPGSAYTNLVVGVYEDRSGKLWMGTYGFGGLPRLTRLDRETGRRTHWQHDPNDPNSLARGWIHAIYEDQEGMIWVGSREFSRIDPEMGAVKRFPHDPTDSTSITCCYISGIAEDSKGNFWISASEGLNLMNRGTETFTRFVHDPNDPLSITPGTVRSVIEDQNGTLWIAGSGLIWMDLDRLGHFDHFLHDPDDLTSLSGNAVWDVLEARDGTLWVGIADGGLNRMDPDQPGHFIHYSVHDGLPDMEVYKILEDEFGYLWISTNQGLSRFDPRTETFRTFDINDGLPSNEFNIVSAYKSPRTGELFFGNRKGVVAFHPSWFEGNPHPPSVVITDFRLFNESVRPGADSPLQQHISETETIRLKYNQHSLSFDYVALHYTDPTENQYRYRLEPYETEWVEAGTQRSVSYTNLEPDTYTFQVMASNSDGVWNEEGAFVTITITPPWWRKMWAYVLYGMLVLGGIVAVDRFQRRRLLRKAEIEQAQLRAEAAELQARALQAENDRKEIELEKAQELEQAYSALDESHRTLKQTHEHLKTTQDQLIHSEKMASLGALTAGIAHEIKNPLNFINNFADINAELASEIMEGLESGDDQADMLAILQDLRRNAEVINTHGKRADAIVRSMMEHARGGSGQREPTEVNVLLEEYINLAYHGMRAQMIDFKCEIVRDYDASVGTVEMVAQEMGRVLVNVLNNAFYAVHERASKENGPYEPTVMVATRQKEDTVEIRVGDNGSGISRKVQEKIFEPFFTTKPTGRGNTGLGLSLSYDIVTQGHSGTLEVESEEGEGATFVIALPVE